MQESCQRSRKVEMGSKEVWEEGMGHPDVPRSVYVHPKRIRACASAAECGQSAAEVRETHRMSRILIGCIRCAAEVRPRRRKCIR